MSDEMNGGDAPQIDKEKLQEMLQGLFGAKPVDSTTMTTNLLVQTMYGVLSVMSDTGMPPGKLVDSIFDATAIHVGGALASLDASGMFVEGTTVAGSIDEMMAVLGKEIVTQYETAKQRLKDEGEWPEDSKDA